MERITQRRVYVGLHYIHSVLFHVRICVKAPVGTFSLMKRLKMPRGHSLSSSISQEIAFLRYIFYDFFFVKFCRQVVEYFKFKSLDGVCICLLAEP